MVGVDARAGVVTLLAPPCAGPGHLMWQRVPPPVLAYPCVLTALFAKNASPGHAFAIWCVAAICNKTGELWRQFFIMPLL